MATARQLRKKISTALIATERTISGHAERSRIASGLSGEGYAGGYRQALMDVLAILNDTYPSDPWNFFADR